MAKDFQGHFEPDDPRGPLWGAGGCDWPTVPPYRLRLGVEDPPAKWDFLRAAGVLLESTVNTGHDLAEWEDASALPDCFDFIRVKRIFVQGETIWLWVIEIQTDCTEQPWVIEHESPIGAGNVDVMIPVTEWDDSQVPAPGGEIGLWQVYFNETVPPEGWPPWA